ATLNGSLLIHRLAQGGCDDLHIRADAACEDLRIHAVSATGVEAPIAWDDPFRLHPSRDLSSFGGGHPAIAINRQNGDVRVERVHLWDNAGVPGVIDVEEVDRNDEAQAAVLGSAEPGRIRWDTFNAGAPNGDALPGTQHHAVVDLLGGALAGDDLSVCA